MFNAELKKEYLLANEYKNLSLENITRVIFGHSENMEKELNKDISNFTIVEIIDFYKSLCFTSFETLDCYTSQLKKYSSYCLNKGLIKDSQNHFEEVTYDVIYDCINQGFLQEKIISRENLLHLLDQCLNPSDKFMCLAIFEGISGKEFCELANLKLSDFNGNELVLSDGKIITVSDELLKFARISSDTFEYMTYNENYFKTLYYDKNDDRIIKRMYNADSETPLRTSQRMYSKMRRIRKYLGVGCFNSKALNESGRIDSIRKLAQIEGVSFRDCLISHKGLQEKYGIIYSYSTYLLKYEDIIEGL